jgi:hypothetical protein
MTGRAGAVTPGMTHDPITDSELEELERDVVAALAAADPSRLTLLGEGEISLVLAGGSGREWACKRLPPFVAADAADRYAATIERYLTELDRRGIDVVDTTLRRVVGADGGDVLYCVQPALPADALAVAVARRDPELGGELLERIVDLVLHSVDDRFGLDAQLSNWALVDGRVVYLDVTTPLLRDGAGVSELDTDVFLASLPWLLRPVVRRFVVPGIVDRYHHPRVVVLDLAANLLRERLDLLVPTVVETSRGRVEPALDDDEIRRDRRLDALTWGALQAVRRLDRTWQRRIRRRAYPFLIPSHRHT